MIKTSRLSIFAVAIFLLAGVTLTVPVFAAPGQQFTPHPTAMIKACHVCDRDFSGEVRTPISTTVLPQSPSGVVRAVLFWMDGCPHCHEVLENVLPALQEEYGAQLAILLLEVVSMDDVDRLLDVAALYNIPPEQAVVPFLIIGDHALIGSRQIPEELSDLIDGYLAQGGVDWPPIPNLNEYLTRVTPNPLATPTMAGAVVRAILFTTPDCRDCQLITVPALGHLKEQYGDQFEVQTLDVVTSTDVEYLYQVAASYGFPKEVVDLPLLIIGDKVLMKEEIPARLPDLVNALLLSGGTGYPQLPPRIETTVTPALIILPAETTTDASSDIGSNGFAIAVVTMALMVAALIYSLTAFVLGKTFFMPDWADWIIPVLIIFGLGVAGYLSYVETQLVKAACGPIGDCNAVQSSLYARLFGVMPVGVLGAIGYLAILAAWLYPRLWRNRIATYMPVLVFGMALFGVLFSLYLTFLEPFVIKAVCMWCISSAGIITLLLLLSLKPALQTIHFLQEADHSHADIDIETPSP